ncbi:unnamed protein product, partial [Effrenium voratum]
VRRDLHLGHPADLRCERAGAGECEPLVVRHLQLALLQRAAAASHAGGVAAGRRLRGGGFPQLPVPGIAGRGVHLGRSAGSGHRHLLGLVPHYLPALRDEA